jgi:predicted nucleic acid-binding Zn ribbon protein
MTITVNQMTPAGSKVPDQATTAKQPALSAEVNALLAAAGCVVKWNGFTWNMTRKGQTYATSRRLNSFEDWQAQVKAVVESTG